MNMCSKEKSKDKRYNHSIIHQQYNIHSASNDRDDKIYTANLYLEITEYTVTL